ncbi:MAG TPA: type II 3-dehydroquinate dehydratase [Solirubrobacteraceae bacterium]|nr:type II 3-dehydroquinate dehydratase [Solirubrobacteraceae bacterium]
MSEPRATSLTRRVVVMHGVNLDQLGRRPPPYPQMTLAELERGIEGDARALGFAASFFHTNHEGEYVERLHALRGPPTQADAVILNTGAWTHYAWAIRDALEIAVSAGVLAAEVHLTDVSERARREPWRGVSVIGELCAVRVAGRGAEGYRDALELLRERLDEHPDGHAPRGTAPPGADPEGGRQAGRRGGA